MVGALGHGAVGPQQEHATSGHRLPVEGELVGRGAVVGDGDAVELDVGVAVVEEFEPVVGLAGAVEATGGVGGHDFVDAQVVRPRIVGDGAAIAGRKPEQAGGNHHEEETRRTQRTGTLHVVTCRDVS